VILSGMIGSRQGWVECPYVPCPAGPEDLARALVSFDLPGGLRLAFVPGVETAGHRGFPDVMRGEETQIAGLLAGAGPGRRVLLLPGTHSKWAVAAEGRIADFSTFMTGEVFAVMVQHSILGRLMTGDRHDPEAFARGLDQAAGGLLLNDLFSARTLGLFGELPGTGLRAYLSGLLIGHEIAEAKRGGLIGTGDAEVMVVGSASLSPLYVEALRHNCLAAVAAPADLAATGLFGIARAAGLVGP
jgi:2-dehydro-3-deoxygalactonokinase